MNYQVCDPLTQDEYDALKQSIAKTGIEVPVVVDENGDILDGHHRMRAYYELKAAGVDIPPPAKDIRRGLSETDKRNLARTLNAVRRQMSKEQRNKLIVAMREDGMSYRQIGEAVGVSDVTALNVVKQSGAKNLAPATITGADGKQYPATKPVVVTPDPEPVAYHPLPADVSEMLDDADDDLDRDWAERVFAEEQWDRCAACAHHREAKFEGEYRTFCTMHVIDILDWKVDAVYPPCYVPESKELCDFSDGTDSSPALRPHVANNSGNNEWYTPEQYIAAARAVMGAIDLDPATSATANTVVQASAIYTAEDDGLSQPWSGRVWMNPPYSADLIGKFVDKLTTGLHTGDVEQAVVLVNNATETAWFQQLVLFADAVCFPRSRVRFWSPDGTPGAPLQGQAVIYAGPDAESFARNFRSFGYIVLPWSNHD